MSRLFCRRWLIGHGPFHGIRGQLLKSKTIRGECLCSPKARLLFAACKVVKLSKRDLFTGFDCVSEAILGFGHVAPQNDRLSQRRMPRRRCDARMTQYRILSRSWSLGRLLFVQHLSHCRSPHNANRKSITSGGFPQRNDHPSMYQGGVVPAGMAFSAGMMNNGAAAFPGGIMPVGFMSGGQCDENCGSWRPLRRWQRSFTRRVNGVSRKWFRSLERG